MQVPQNVQDAFTKAQFARKNAYAEYSGVKVGAAIKVKGVVDIYFGANVEYVINGISVCAERNAINQAVSHCSKIEIEFVVVCSNTDPALYPCGVCLQSMAEFSKPDLDIWIGNKDSIIDHVKFKDLHTHQYASLPKVLSEN